MTQLDTTFPPLICQKGYFMNDHLSNEAWDGALVKELGKENMDIEYARVEKKKEHKSLVEHNPKRRPSRCMNMTIVCIVENARH